MGDRTNRGARVHGTARYTAIVTSLSLLAVQLGSTQTGWASPGKKRRLKAYVLDKQDWRRVELPSAVKLSTGQLAHFRRDKRPALIEGLVSRADGSVEVGGECVLTRKQGWGGQRVSLLLSNGQDLVFSGCPYVRYRGFGLLARPNPAALILGPRGSHRREWVCARELLAGDTAPDLPRLQSYLRDRHLLAWAVAPSSTVREVWQVLHSLEDEGLRGPSEEEVALLRAAYAQQWDAGLFPKELDREDAESGARSLRSWEKRELRRSRGAATTGRHALFERPPDVPQHFWEVLGALHAVGWIHAGPIVGQLRRLPIHRRTERWLAGRLAEEFDPPLATRLTKAQRRSLGRLGLADYRRRLGLTRALSRRFEEGLEINAHVFEELFAVKTRREDFPACLALVDSLKHNRLLGGVASEIVASGRRDRPLQDKAAIVNTVTPLYIRRFVPRVLVQGGLGPRSIKKYFVARRALFASLEELQSQVASILPKQHVRHALEAVDVLSGETVPGATRLVDAAELWSSLLGVDGHDGAPGGGAAYRRAVKRGLLRRFRSRELTQGQVVDAVFERLAVPMQLSERGLRHLTGSRHRQRKSLRWMAHKAELVSRAVALLEGRQRRLSYSAWDAVYFTNRPTGDALAILARLIPWPGTSNKAGRQRLIVPALTSTWSLRGLRGWFGRFERCGLHYKPAAYILGHASEQHRVSMAVDMAAPLPDQTRNAVLERLLRSQGTSDDAEAVISAATDMSTEQLQRLAAEHLTEEAAEQLLSRLPAN